MHQNQSHADTIKDCLECHRLCTEAIAHVLHGKSSHSESKHLVALLDCSQLCLLCADFMTRNSPHHAHICAECAEVCNACADLCEQHADPDGVMKQCAEACRKCAASCGHVHKGA
ncbi:ferredoxin [Pseudorhodoferax aquiterrae]|uniref:Ferredoxin n=1 Tax=Pseudorhodoferax aquiterrae TaxID=747304 RepID=A0ABQ3G661_9BURK|nr:four-helix bundle copper-binding protein [Pseudorhodoferax aquiterrae]GHC92875.1 ferredoxin [Pseudorhodoferax aquiterrae]